MVGTPFDRALVNVGISTRRGTIEPDFQWGWCRMTAETDGWGHDRNHTQQQDHNRDDDLNDEGWHVVRFRDAQMRTTRQVVQRLTAEARRHGYSVPG